MSADPAADAPEPALDDPEVEVPDDEVVVVDESPEHDEAGPVSGLAAGVVVAGLVVVVVGSVLVELVVELVVVVSVLWAGVVVVVVVVAGGVAVDGVVLSELVAGQPVLRLLGVVVAAGVVDPGSTVESVWVWVRPGGSGAGVILAFVTGLIVAVSFLATVLTVLTAGLCAVGAGAFFTAGLWATMMARCSIFGRTAGAWVTVWATVEGVGTEAIWVVVAAAW